MRGALSRTAGKAVALPGSCRSLKKPGFWKGRLMVSSYSSALGITCSLPGTAPLECGGGFVCIPVHESEEAGDKKQELNTSALPFTWVRRRQRRSFASQLEFWFPGQSQGHLSMWSPWIIGVFVLEEPLRWKEKEDLLKREELGHWDLFSLNAINFLPFFFYIFQSLLF